MRTLLGLLIVAAALVAASSPGLSQPLQRMLVAPGCYEVRPGDTADVSAYCLDEERRAPPNGAVLGRAPPGLGDAVVSAGTESMSLASAIAAGSVRIEGLGEFAQVRLRNLTTRPLRVCFRAPTIVMGSDGAIGALKGAYERIKEIVARHEPDAVASTAPKQRAETQRELWDLVTMAERAPPRKRVRPGPAPTGTVDAGRPSGRSGCVGDPESTVVCRDE